MSTELYPLNQLSGLLIGGQDAMSFLQGQLSNDVEALSQGECQLTSLSNPKGRIISLIYLVSLEPGLLMILPSNMTPQIRDYLQRYVFRSKVTLTLPNLQIGGTLTRPESNEFQDLVTVSLDSSKTRHFVLNFGTQWQLEPTSSDALWQKNWVRSGRPWIQPETQETFVAQMLNLDLLDGISWTKGCYTGQEIIARVHYRGKNKRRMLGFSVQTEVAISPGDQIFSNDKPVGTVVNVFNTGKAQELLAVLQLSAWGSNLTIEGDAQGMLTNFELPYAIPELAAL